MDLAHSAREIDGLRGPHENAGGARLDQEQRYGVPPRARGDQHQLRARHPRDEELRAGEPPAVARAARGVRDAARVVAVALLQVGEGGEALARDQLRQPRLALRRRAGAQEGVDHELGRQERPRGGRAAELLEHQRQVEGREPEPAVRLRHDEPHPAELGHLGVERARHPVRHLRGLAHERGRALAREELARRALERLLLIGEPEVDHFPRGSRGMPSPRSAMMFFWICEVPPPMMRPSEYMKSVGHTPPSRAHGSRLWSGPYEPRTSSAARAMSWFSSVVTSWLTEAEMPGGRLRSASVSCR